MKTFIFALCLMGWAGLVSASEGGPALLEAHVNLDSKPNLQRGARTFVNYCLSCHSASFMRYSRLVDDLGLPKEVVEKNLMFTTDKIGDVMQVAMKPADGEQWFGVPPPDLSVIARARGADWLYSFLMGFYKDDKRPTGVNNLYFPTTAMPAVLSRLQGVQVLKPAAEGEAAHGEGHAGHAGPTLELAMPGTQSPEEYAATVRDLVSFMVYLGEPAKLVRYKIGFWVLAFLFVLFISTYLLKKEYWKDVH
ncbi:MAG: cytochrome c1 [Proteobacteria bacterium]|nr:cytochrome c1 [Pseudomonadota bacterium]